MRKSISVLTVLLLCFAVLEPQANGLGKRVVFMPFFDESGYKRQWDLPYEIPEMIGDLLGGADDYFYVVPMDSVKALVYKPEKRNIFSKFIGLFVNQKRKQQIFTDGEILSAARSLDGDYVITGVITDFNFGRWGGVEPMIGGYKSYKASVSVDQVRILKVSDGRPLGTVRGEETKKGGGLGLTLLGKPSRLDLEMYSLDSLEFGSKRFLSTLLGQTAVEALNKVNKEIRAVIAKPDSSWFSLKKFKVVTIDKSVVFINAGAVDGVSSGDIYNVFAAESGILVGKINIIEVMSDHMSRGEILEGKDEIRREDFIRPEM